MNRRGCTSDLMPIEGSQTLLRYSQWKSQWKRLADRERRISCLPDSADSFGVALFRIRGSVVDKGYRSRFYSRKIARTRYI